MTNQASPIYAAAFARRRSMLAGGDEIAHAEAVQAMQVIPPGLSSAERALLVLCRRDALILRDDGIGWRDAVYRAALARRRGDAGADDLVADLLVQAPYRLDKERETLAAMLSDTLLPEIRRGRPAGHTAPWHVQAAAAAEYLERKAAVPHGHAERLRSEIAGKLDHVGADSLRRWVTEYARNVQAIDAIVRNRALETVQQRMSRQTERGCFDRARIMRDYVDRLTDKQVRRMERLGFGGAAFMRQTIRNNGG